MQRCCAPSWLSQAYRTRVLCGKGEPLKDILRLEQEGETLVLLSTSRGPWLLNLPDFSWVRSWAGPLGASQGLLPVVWSCRCGTCGWRAASTDFRLALSEKLSGYPSARRSAAALCPLAAPSRPFPFQEGGLEGDAYLEMELQPTGFQLSSALADAAPQSGQPLHPVRDLEPVAPASVGAQPPTGLGSKPQTR